MNRFVVCFIVILIFFTSVVVHAQNENPLAGGKSSGMSNASVMNSDVWSVFNNQAGIGNMEEISVGMHYENRFFSNKMSLKSFGAVVPIKAGTFGLSVYHWGYSKYAQSKIGLAYGKKLGEKISMGIQLDYINTYFAQDYGNKGVAVAEVGILSESIENLTIGAHVFNPTRAKLSDYQDERLPTVFRLGLGYKFGEKTFVCAEAEKDMEYKPIYKFGAEYLIYESLAIRAGVAANPVSYSFGLGYNMKKIKADFAFSSNPYLGYTPHLSVSYSIK